MEVVKSLAALLKDSTASLIEKEKDHVQPAFPVMQVRGGASSSPLTVVLEDCSFEVTDIVADEVDVSSDAISMNESASLAPQILAMNEKLDSLLVLPGKSSMSSTADAKQGPFSCGTRHGDLPTELRRIAEEELGETDSGREEALEKLTQLLQ
ncbi:uncharacterized protein ISCGN_003626, partial [Ixodes scapularis]